MRPIRLPLGTRDRVRKPLNPQIEPQRGGRTQPCPQREIRQRRPHRPQLPNHLLDHIDQTRQNPGEHRQQRRYCPAHDRERKRNERRNNVCENNRIVLLGHLLRGVLDLIAVRVDGLAGLPRSIRLVVQTLLQMV
ncbi:hypothetical protein [Actinoallomurus sp. CA-150999]|uniref:hypothetical protein n=1 Tax=Actinoallomurus sp. CA-150999 TaxID=3239887 RepID=UPI003D8DE2C4